VIYGLDADALDPGFIPLEATVVLKCLDGEGDVVLVTRSTDGLKAWDRVGLLSAALDLDREETRRAFSSDDGEDPETG
jgi:hypothetical protein